MNAVKEAPPHAGTSSRRSPAGDRANARRTENPSRSISSSGTTGQGAPLELPLGMVDEDPDQVRKTFDSETLEELASSIKARGVRSPISVKRHPKDPQRYLVNHGARRLRASRIAGMATIPAFVDENYTDDDQITENIQRENLTPREIAEFIDRKLKANVPQAEIGRIIGKSRSYITKYNALNKLPGPIAQAFHSGHLTDVNTIYMLFSLYQEAPDEVAAWVTGESLSPSREAVELLKEEIRANQRYAIGAGSAASGGVLVAGEKLPDYEVPESTELPNTLRKPVVMCEIDERGARHPVRLLFKKRPSGVKKVWIRYEETGKTVEVLVSRLTLSGLIEG